MPRFVDIDAGTVPVNVMHHGAKGDGTADDTVAVHAARDAAGVDGVLEFPPGTYLVTGAAGLTANVAGQTWVLAPGAVVKASAGVLQILKITAPNVTVNGGVWDQSAATTGIADYQQMAIRIEGSVTATGTTADGATICNATLKRAPVYGIYGVGCSRVTVDNCKFFDNRGSAAFFIYVINTDIVPNDITITNNLVDNVTSGIDFSLNNPTGWVPSGFGLRPGEHNTNDAFTKWGSRYKVTGNVIRMSPRIGNSAGGGLEVMNARGVTINGNVISGGMIGISLGNPWQCSVSGNSVKGFDGIGIELGGHVKNCTISGNTIDPDGVGPGYGISSSGSGARIMRDVSITGNTVSTFPIGSSAGIGMDFISYDGLSITGNVITSDVSSGKFNGIQFLNTQSLNRVIISGNLIDANSSSNSRGIEFYPLGPVTGVTITGNQFNNLAVSAVALSTVGAGSSYSDVYMVGNHVSNTPTATEGGGWTAGTNIVTGSTDTQIFLTSGTWTKPPGASTVHVLCIGPGGGGGAGARGPSGTALSGGGGGGSGAVSAMTFDADALTATVSVTVGVGGAGAPGQTADDTAGAAGGFGSPTTNFGAYLFAGRSATGGGGGGLGAAGSVGSAGAGMFTGAAGGAGSATGAAGGGGTGTAGGGGGGGGGGINTGGTAAAGGVGGVPTWISAAGATGGNGANGGNGISQTTKGPGGGGGGGGANAGGAGYNGGNGGSFGAGGGGGGASLNGNTSGAGGDGADGIVIVTTFF